MSFVAAITAVALIVVPLAALLLSMFLGPTRAAIMLIAVTGLAVCAPYLYFGFRALIEGYELAPVLSGVSVSTGPILTIAWVTVQWSLAALILGTVVRTLWNFSRKENV